MCRFWFTFQQQPGHSIGCYVFGPGDVVNLWYIFFAYKPPPQNSFGIDFLQVRFLWSENTHNLWPSKIILNNPQVLLQYLVFVYVVEYLVWGPVNVWIYNGNWFALLNDHRTGVIFSCIVVCVFVCFGLHRVRSFSIVGWWGFQPPNRYTVNY